jgi:hypothetical protein
MSACFGRVHSFARSCLRGHAPVQLPWHNSAVGCRSPAPSHALHVVSSSLSRLLSVVHDKLRRHRSPVSSLALRPKTARSLEQYVDPPHPHTQPHAYASKHPPTHPRAHPPSTHKLACTSASSEALTALAVPSLQRYLRCVTMCNPLGTTKQHQKENSDAHSTRTRAHLFSIMEVCGRWPATQPQRRRASATTFLLT